jgi:hypothetical protein
LAAPGVVVVTGVPFVEIAVADDLRTLVLSQSASPGITADMVDCEGDIR